MIERTIRVALAIAILCAVAYWLRGGRLQRSIAKAAESREAWRLDRNERGQTIALHVLCCGLVLLALAIASS